MDDSYRSRIFEKAGIKNEVTVTEYTIKAQRSKIAFSSLLQTPPLPIDQVAPHAYPPKIIARISKWSYCDFDRIEMQYNGTDVPLEIATSANLHHDLTALIKSRS